MGVLVERSPWRLQPLQSATTICDYNLQEHVLLHERPKMRGISEIVCGTHQRALCASRVEGDLMRMLFLIGVRAACLLGV